MKESVGYRLGKWFRQLPVPVRWVLVIGPLPIIIFSGVLPVILTLLGVGVACYLLFYTDDREWREKYLSLEEYWQRYPRTKTRNGTTCYYCCAIRIESYPWNNDRSRRIHYCHQCRTPLYRSLDER
ncbi:hypothetical protein ACU62C_02520 [Klebsiella aerogenes]